MNSIRNYEVLPTQFDVEGQTQEKTSTWPTIRYLLVIWSVAIWVLMILIPGVEHMSHGSIQAIAMNMPYIFMGLVLVGAIFASHNLEEDKHLLWFLTVLILLAGWV